MLNRTCLRPNCDEPHHGRGYCETHYGQARNQGTEISYQDMHLRLKADRGPASQHPCTDCGAPAREWSYDYRDPNEVRSGIGTRFSLDLWHYEPRCAACHRTRDHQERKAELQHQATELEPQIRSAIVERDRARHHGDRQAEDHWDDELERLTAQLLTS
ncbi:hypothetical protein H7H51_07660 [Mycolicibacterium farcinogenes]|nr:hypothetical protein [Mycolicibacterium farcinogenes]